MRGENMNYPWLDEYLLRKKAAVKDFKVEWQWDRYRIGEKMFAALCYGEDGKQILTVKCEPEYGRYLRENYSDITSGYYMNKVHWNSVDLDGNVPDSVIMDMIEQSYSLVLSSLSKKRRIEVGEE